MAKTTAKKPPERKAKPVGEPWPDIGIKPEIELYPHDEAHLYVTEGRYTGVKKETLEKAKADYKKEVDSLRAIFRDAEFNPEKIPVAIQTFKKIKNRYSIKLNKFLNPTNAVRLLPGFYNLQCDIYKALLQKADYYTNELEAVGYTSQTQPRLTGWRKHLYDNDFVYSDGKSVVKNLDLTVAEYVTFTEKNPTSKFIMKNFLKSNGTKYSEKACDKARDYANTK